MTSLPTGTIRRAPRARNLSVSRRGSQVEPPACRCVRWPVDRARATARSTSPRFQREKASRTSKPSALRYRPSTASLPSSARYRLARALESKYTVVTILTVLLDKGGDRPAGRGRKGMPSPVRRHPPASCHVSHSLLRLWNPFDPAPTPPRRGIPGHSIGRSLHVAAFATRGVEGEGGRVRHRVLRPAGRPKLPGVRDQGRPGERAARRVPPGPPSRGERARP